MPANASHAQEENQKESPYEQNRMTHPCALCSLVEYWTNLSRWDQIFCDCWHHCSACGSMCATSARKHVCKHVCQKRNEALNETDMSALEDFPSSLSSRICHLFEIGSTFAHGQNRSPQRVS